MNHCKITAICINFELLDKIWTTKCLNEYVHLLRVQWQCMDNTVEKVLYITISPVNGDHYSDIIKRLLENNMAVQEFAKKMYSAYKLRLRTLEYPPFVLTFEQCTDAQSTRLNANRKTLIDLLKDLFLKEKGVRSSKLEYRINIQMGQSQTEYRPCHCFCPSSGGYDQVDQKHGRCLSPLEERFQSVEEELSHQKRLLATQLNEQQRQHENITTKLTKIVESLSQSHKTSDGVKCDAVNSAKIKPLSVPSKVCSLGGLKKQCILICGATSEEGKLNEHGRENRSTTNEEAFKGTGDMTEGNTKVFDVKMNGQDQTLTGGRGEAGDFTFSQKSATSSTRKCESHFQEPTAIKVEGGLDGYTSENNMLYSGRAALTTDPTTRVDTQSSPYKSSSRHSQYQDPHKGPQYSTSENDTSTLVVPTDDFYSPPVSTQPYMDQDVLTYCGGSGHVDSIPGIFEDNRYYTSAQDPFPDIQTDQLNFNLRRTGQLFTVATDRTSKLGEKDKPWVSPLGRQKLRLMIECIIGNSSNWKRLSESCEAAMLGDASRVLRIDQAMDTVLCLDTSGSMAGDAFEKMKRITNEFIDGVEAIAENHNIEENIAIVTFGGRAKVIHHLSNDYGSLRKALERVTCGGPSPILEALVVSMACLTNGGVYHINKNIKLPPRLVFFSDGNPTRTIREDAEDDYWIDQQEQVNICKAFSELSNRQLDDDLPSPVIFVPVGSYVTMDCLETIAFNSGGVVTSTESFPKMCKFQRLQTVAIDALRCLFEKGLDINLFQSGFHDFISQIGYDVSPADATQIYEMVKLDAEKMIIHYGSKYSFYNIQEKHGLPPLGSRVIRGPNWKWGNQDTEGAGTIFNHSSDKLVWVCWDNDHVNVYRYGYNGKYDLATVEDQPRVLEGYALDIGVQVQRGPDWHRLYEDQDHGNGHYGVVIRTNQLGKVMVRWQNGQIFDYRCGYLNRYDVVVRDPITSILETTARVTLQSAKIQGPCDKTEVIQDSQYEWERKDAVKGWESYSPVNSAKLKKAYLKNQLGSCLIQSNGQSFRVSFKALTERSLKDNSSVPVRLHIPECKFYYWSSYSEASTDSLSVKLDKTNSRLSQPHLHVPEMLFIIVCTQMSRILGNVKLLYRSLPV